MKATLTQGQQWALGTCVAFPGAHEAGDRQCKGSQRASGEQQ